MGHWVTQEELDEIIANFTSPKEDQELVVPMFVNIRKAIVELEMWRKGSLTFEDTVQC